MISNKTNNNDDFVLDFGDLPEPEGAPTGGGMPEGIYDAKLEFVEVQPWTESEASKHGFGYSLNFQFRITGPRYANKVLWMTLYPNKDIDPETGKNKSLIAMQRQFNALGFKSAPTSNTPTTYTKDGDKKYIETHEGHRVTDIPCKVNVFNSEWQGETKPKVRWIVFEKNTSAPSTPATSKSASTPSFGGRRRLG